MIKAAVIGVGSMGRNHARVYRELSETTLVGVADMSLDLAERTAGDNYTRAYSDYRELLDREQPDIVSVAVPTREHADVASAALSAGCHVLVEKPIAFTIEEGIQLIRQARQCGKKLTVGHLVRFDAALQQMVERLRSNELGRVFQVRSRRLGPFPARIQDVGVVVDLATHDLDIAAYITDDHIVRVYAETERQIHSSQEDILIGTARLDRGAMAFFDINWLTPYKIRELTVTGERGMFLVDYLAQDLYFYENQDAVNIEWEPISMFKGVSEGRMVKYPVAKTEPLKAELRAFAKAVIDDTPVAVRPEEGLAALECALAMVKSGREGRPCGYRHAEFLMSTWTSLAEKITDKRAEIVVIGLGYVGLPVGCLFARAGFSVTGIDVKAERIDQINRGKSPIEGREPGLAELLADLVGGRAFRASSDYSACLNANVILIAVETPIDRDGKQPRYQALRSVLTSLAPHLQPGTLIIVESTIAPGTMQHVVLGELESRSSCKIEQDYLLVHCPERLMPGRLIQNIQQMDRVVGGWTETAAELACLLYSNIVQGTLEPTDCLTAELVKTSENAYRDVQIAFANEVAMICEANGADVWRVRELVNKSPGRHMLLPGAGVGGHCIPKDPWLLAYSAGNNTPLRLIPAARAVNDDMPKHVTKITLAALTGADLDAGKATVLVLGYAYLENSDDTRNSPTEALIEHLAPQVDEVRIHDPWVAHYQGDLYQLAEQVDALILMVKHDQYRNLDIQRMKTRMRTAIVIDGRGFWRKKEIYEAGMCYRGIGQGPAR